MSDEAQEGLFLLALAALLGLLWLRGYLAPAVTAAVGAIVAPTKSPFSFTPSPTPTTRGK